MERTASQTRRWIIAAVALFLDRRIGFLDIARLVADATAAQPVGSVTDVESIFDADQAAREYVLSHF